MFIILKVNESFNLENILQERGLLRAKIVDDSSVDISCRCYFREEVDVNDLLTLCDNINVQLDSLKR